jgi:hypothetical protein
VHTTLSLPELLPTAVLPAVSDSREAPQPVRPAAATAIAIAVIIDFLINIKRTSVMNNAFCAAQ